MRWVSAQGASKTFKHRFSLAGRAALRSQEAPLPIDKDPGAARPNQGLREQFAGQRFNEFPPGHALNGYPRFCFLRCGTLRVALHDRGLRQDALLSA